MSVYSDVISGFLLRELLGIGRQNTEPLIFTKDWIISQLKLDLWTCNFTVILFLGKWIHNVIYLCEVDFDMCTMYVMADTQWRHIGEEFTVN